MAYEPKEWVCGEYVTADGLNNLEQGVQEALAKECDCGFSCSESETELFSGTITTADRGDGFYINYIPDIYAIEADTIKVVYDGVTYTLNKDANGNYGTTDYDLEVPIINFDDCPFLILSYGSNLILATETAGEHELEIYEIDLSVTTSECFRTAVKSVGGGASGEVVGLDVPNVTTQLKALKTVFSNNPQSINNNVANPVSLSSSEDLPHPSNVIGFAIEGVVLNNLPTGLSEIEVLTSLYHARNSNYYQVVLSNETSSPIWLDANTIQITALVIYEENVTSERYCVFTSDEDCSEDEEE